MSFTHGSELRSKITRESNMLGPVLGALCTIVKNI